MDNASFFMDNNDLRTPPPKKKNPFSQGNNSLRPPWTSYPSGLQSGLQWQLNDQENLCTMTDGRQTRLPNLPPVASEVVDSCYYFADSSFQAGASLSLLSAGRERCLPDYQVSRSDYPCVVIEFIFEGKGYLQMGEVIHDLYPGVIASYGLDVAHCLWSDPDCPMGKFFVAYSHPDKEHALLATMPCIHPGEVKCCPDINALQMLFQELITEGRRGGHVHRLLCEKYLDLILLKSSIAHAIDRGNENGGLSSFKLVVAHIEQHFVELSSLADLAQNVSLDSTYICRLFQRFGQESPHQCIMRHKLNLAAELLVQETDSIKAIATQVGYHDPFHFSRLFKKRFGNSPMNFRKSLHNLPARHRKP